MLSIFLLIVLLTTVSTGATVDDSCESLRKLGVDVCDEARQHPEIRKLCREIVTEFINQCQ